MVATILKTLKKHVRNCLTIQNKWRLSGNFWHNQKICLVYQNFLDQSENIQTIQKLSRLSWNFPDHPENIRPIRKLSRLSGNFLDHPEDIQTIRKLSGTSANFPDGLETSQCNFKGYAQKLSGRAITFRMAMPRCHDGFCASALLFSWSIYKVRLTEKKKQHLVRLFASGQQGRQQHSTTERMVMKNTMLITMTTTVTILKW